MGSPADEGQGEKQCFVTDGKCSLHPTAYAWEHEVRERIDTGPSRELAANMIVLRNIGRPSIISRKLRAA